MINQKQEDIKDKNVQSKDPTAIISRKIRDTEVKFRTYRYICLFDEVRDIGKRCHKETEKFGEVDEDWVLKEYKHYVKCKGEDIKDTDKDYHFWKYMISLLFFGVKEGRAYFLKDNPIDLSVFKNLKAEFRTTIDPKCDPRKCDLHEDGRFRIEITAPMSVINSYDPDLKLISGKKKMILDADKGILFDVKLLKLELKEHIAI